MDDSPKAIFIRELSFCLIKTALFCLVTIMSNIIFLIAAYIIGYFRVPQTMPAIYFGFSLFAIASTLVFFLIGRYLLAFNERSPKDYAVPIMIFAAGTIALIKFRDPLTMAMTLSWNTLLQWFISHMGGPDLLAVPVLIGIWFVCCIIIWAGIRTRPEKE